MNFSNTIDLFLIKHLLKENSSEKDKENFLKNWHSKAKYKFSLNFFRQNEIPEKVLSNVNYGSYFDGMLWLTNQRIFFTGENKEKLLSQPKPVYHQFIFPSIEVIEYRKGSFFGMPSIVIHTLTTSAHGNVAKTIFESANISSFIEDFVVTAQQKIKEIALQPNNNYLSTVQNSDIVSKLKELEELKRNSLLSDEEFEKAKKILLS